LLKAAAGLKLWRVARGRSSGRRDRPRALGIRRGLPIHDHAPRTYEALIQAIHAHYDGLSRSFQVVARWVTQNPNDVAMLSISAIAQRCGVHPSSLVRFAQHFGYRGFRELQAIFHSRLATAAPGFDARVHGLKAELGLHQAEGVRGFLNDLVVRDIAALEDLLQSADAAELERAVDLLARAETIYVLGQLRSEPVALFVRYVLTMLERRVVLLDAPGGLTTHLARTMTAADVLVAISFRFYAKEVVSIAESAQAAGVPVLAVSDSRLSPLAKSATVLFPVPEDEYMFSRSLAAPMCLVQALMIGLAARLQPDRDAAMPLIRRASDPDRQA